MALNGDPLADTGWDVGYVSHGSLANSGAVVFQAGERVGGPYGLFLWKDGVVSKIAQAGDPAPGTSGTFWSFYISRPFLEERIAFVGLITDSAASSGVFVAVPAEEPEPAPEPPPRKGAAPLP